MRDKDEGRHVHQLSAANRVLLTYPHSTHLKACRVEVLPVPVPAVTRVQDLVTSRLGVSAQQTVVDVVHQQMLIYIYSRNGARGFFERETLS